jgi:hypothetical protein
MTFAAVNAVGFFAKRRRLTENRILSGELESLIESAATFPPAPITALESN